MMNSKQIKQFKQLKKLKEFKGHCLAKDELIIVHNQVRRFEDPSLFEPLNFLDSLVFPYVGAAF